VFREFCRGIKISLAECRSAAAAPLLQERDFESERFEYFHCGNADVRFVIAHKRVVPENDFASSGERGRLARCVTRLAGHIESCNFLELRNPSIGFWRGAKNSGRGARAPQTFREPFVEAFICVLGQRSVSGDSNGFLHCNAHGLGIEKSIRQPRHETAEFTYQVKLAQNTFAQRHAIAAPSRVKHFCLKQRQVHVRRTFRRATFTRETIAQRGV
jgi:hypothetical protein